MAHNGEWTMRMSKARGWCASLVAMTAALVALSAATDARADAEFTATAGAGSVSVTIPTGSQWHINKEAPWKVTVGTTSLTKEKWALTELSATVSGVPAGDATVKVYICNGDQCKNAEVKVVVK